MKLSKEQGFPQIYWIASLIDARALVEEGRLETSISQIKEAVAARQAMGAASGGLILRAMLAEAHGVANRHDEALQVLAEALEFWDRTGEGLYLPEIHRLKGELLLRRNAPDAAVEAVVCFRQALDVARRQQSKLLELRAAASLARLRRDQGKIAEANDLLAPVYAWFTEGFETPDLEDAKALLDDLS